MGLRREYLPLSDLGLPLGDLGKANQSCLQALGSAITNKRTFHDYRVISTPPPPVLGRDSNEDLVGIPLGRESHSPVRSPNRELAIGKIVLPTKGLYLAFQAAHLSTV